MVPLSVTMMVVFGVILYGFSVCASDGAVGGEFSTTALSIAYGGRYLSAGSSPSRSAVSPIGTVSG